MNPPPRGNFTNRWTATRWSVLKALIRPSFPDPVEHLFLEPRGGRKRADDVSRGVGEGLESGQLRLGLGVRLELPGLLLGQLAVDGAMNVSPGGHLGVSFPAFSRQ